MMKLSGSRCVSIPVLIIAAGLLYMVGSAEGVDEFRRCYKTSVEMHCFTVQYDTNNRTLVASNDNARQRCKSLNSTLIVIKDEEMNTFVKNYMSDSSNPMSNQYVWTDAYQISDYNNSYTWHWLNSRLPTMAAGEVTWLRDYKYYVTTLEFRTDDGKTKFYLTAKLPQESYSYVCEYADVSRCSSASSSAFQLQDRICYIPFSASVSWYEARNRCLKDGGDLASFANVTNVNSTSWLGSDTNIRFWIGLRFTWYIWKNSGLDVKFINWITNNDWNKLCLVTCSNCGASLGLIPTTCSDVSYVVCHSVTPLETTTLSMAITTTIQETTSTAVITTQNGNPKSTQPPSNSSIIEKSTASSQVALGVGVGIGVGVPVIVAIIVLVICVVRRHQSKKPESSTAKQDDETLPTSEGVDISHYATIRSVSPPQPSAVENESTHETEYAKLDFNEAAALKNNNGHIPLDVL